MMCIHISIDMMTIFRQKYLTSVITNIAWHYIFIYIFIYASYFSRSNVMKRRSQVISKSLKQHRQEFF